MASTVPARKSVAALTLTAVGVVYGDIGTSPLYALRECFAGTHSVPPTFENVLGVLSLIVYSLVIVISIKYIAIVMRADNQGEGGILALTALIPTSPQQEPRPPVPARRLWRRVVIRRRDDYARDHGARRDRRAQRRHAGLPRLRRADRRGDPDWRLRGPAAWDRPGRPLLSVR